MKYTIVRSGNLRDLINKINEELKNGWTHAGGVTFDGNDYLQALIYKH
jgi:long-subunit fatty acid transport protein